MTLIAKNMKLLISCLFWMIAVESANRIGIRDAFEWRKNNSRRKKDYKRFPLWRHLMRIYPEDSANAPWHMKIFQLFRIFNLCIVIIIVMLAVIIECNTAMQEYQLSIASVVWAIFYLPHFLYTIFLCIKCKGKTKQLDFSSCKRP